MEKFFCYFAMAAALAVPVCAEEPGITKEQADAILSELRQIRQILAQQAKLAAAAAQPQEPAPQKAQLKLDDSYMIGRKDAPVTMVEFTDYQCPFCQRFHIATYNEIKKNYIDTGKVRFFSRDMPLDFHPNAFKAATAARCAGEQNQYWPMRDVLGANPGSLSLDEMAGFAGKLKLDVKAFRACVESDKYREEITRDMKTAASIGLNGTPAFVIGKTTPDGVEGEVVVGALPYPVFDEKLKSFSTPK